METYKKVVTGTAYFNCLSLLFFILIFTASAFASSESDIIQKAQTLHLPKQTTWLKLLHYDGKQSVVLTGSFFLSPDGRKNPEAELSATLHAYFLPWGDKPNEHPRCQFPARYYWINQQLPLPDYKINEDKCENLRRWALFDSVKSISVLLVSGYFGNPASTFGHAFLKFNTDSSDDKQGLFDLTLSYGAMVPDHENGVLYVVRGLFGGYKAGFSDKYFYTQDMVYSRTEFRDIWDYRLRLSEYKRRLLMLHIWELAGKKFDYYFLDKNCAYRLGELLEIVIDDHLVQHQAFWYLPVELFYHLKKTNLIDAVQFVPSSQRVLYHQLKLLTPQELKALNRIIKEGSESIPVRLSFFSTDRQIIILDALLAYEQYRVIAEEPKSDKDAKEGSKRQIFKDKVLLSRLQLPVHEKATANIKPLPSPADGSRPMVLGARIASNKTFKHPFLRLNYSPFKLEMVGQNSLEGNEFIILDTAVGILEDGHRAFIDEVDVVRILKLNTLAASVADENRLSWELSLGAKHIERTDEGRYDGAGIFGVGYAWNLAEHIIGYGMIDGAAHTIAPYGRLRPHLGLRLDAGLTKVWIYSGGETIDYKCNFHEIWGGKIQYQLSPRWALISEVSNEGFTRASLGLNWYW